MEEFYYWEGWLGGISFDDIKSKHIIMNKETNMLEKRTI